MIKRIYNLVFKKEQCDFMFPRLDGCSSYCVKPKGHFGNHVDFSGTPYIKELQPVHPGQILEEFFLIPIGYSVEEVADMIEEDVEDMYHVIQASAPITEALDSKLCDLFAMPKGQLLHLQDMYDKAMKLQGVNYDSN